MCLRVAERLNIHFRRLAPHREVYNPYYPSIISRLSSFGGESLPMFLRSRALIWSCSALSPAPAPDLPFPHDKTSNHLTFFPPRFRGFGSAPSRRVWGFTLTLKNLSWCGIGWGWGGFFVLFFKKRNERGWVGKQSVSARSSKQRAERAANGRKRKKGNPRVRKSSHPQSEHRLQSDRKAAIRTSEHQVRPSFPRFPATACGTTFPIGTNAKPRNAKADVWMEGNACAE